MFRKKQNYFELNLSWNKTENSEFPFQIDYNGHKFQLRINDFPDEHMYSLIVDSIFVCDFDDWPKNWKR